MENRVREELEGQWDNKRPVREKGQNQSSSVALYPAMANLDIFEYAVWSCLALDSHIYGRKYHLILNTVAKPNPTENTVPT